MQPLSGPPASIRSPDAPPVPLASPAWTSLRSDGIDWIVREDCAQLLLGADGLRWEAWKRQDALEVVKTGPHRTVYRLDLAGGTFYVKHFRVADWRAALRNLIRPSPAERELHAVQRIAALRLPTFEPVALGLRRLWGATRDTYLISRAIPEAVPLDHFLLTEFALRDSARQAELRQRLTREMGRLAARLHAAGIEHVDLHAGNLLIRPGAAPNEPLLSLIDLHAVRFVARLSPRKRERNLAALHQFFAGRSTRSDRRRFWLAYAEGTRDISPDDRGPSDERIERILADAARAGWRRADRAWKRGNRHVRRLDAGAVKCRGLASLDADRLTTIRDAAESLFDQHLVRWCKRSGGHRVAEVALSLGPSAPPAEGAGRDGTNETPPQAFWKGITETGGIVRWLGRWRMSPVRRAWEAGHALLRRGIDTPKPLLYVEEPDGAGRRLYLLTEAVTDGVTIHEFFRTRWPALSDEGRSSWLKRHSLRLARQMRCLHDSGFDHRDLKFPNLLVSTDPDDDRVWLLDLDAVRRRPWLPRFRAVQNVARLNVSALLVVGLRATDRLRFLRWYLGPRFAAEWKGWWRAIASKSRCKIARNRRHSRPLS